MQIKDSTFIVTGGASGLGEGTVKMLIAGGANAVIADLQADKGEALAKQLGAKARFVKCDVTSEADGQAAVDHGAATVGPRAHRRRCQNLRHSHPRYQLYVEAAHGE